MLIVVRGSTGPIGSYAPRLTLGLLLGVGRGETIPKGSGKAKPVPQLSGEAKPVSSGLGKVGSSLEGWVGRIPCP
jgi:hypothetical protein